MPWGLEFETVIYGADTNQELDLDLTRLAIEVEYIRVKYLDKEDKLTNSGVIKLREEFIKLWAKSNDPRKKSMFLLDYCSKIEANGNFNTYSNLILSEGNPEDAEKWLRKNTSSINSYIKWQEKNPFLIDRNTNYTKIDN
jgi:hypothetical protein